MYRFSPYKLITTGCSGEVQCSFFLFNPEFKQTTISRDRSLDLVSLSYEVYMQYVFISWYQVCSCFKRDQHNLHHQFREY